MKTLMKFLFSAVILGLVLANPSAWAMGEGDLLSASEADTCMITSNQVHCWGRNQTGIANVPALTNPTKVTVGETHACAIHDGGVKCWGDLSKGLNQIPSFYKPRLIAAGSWYTCVVDEGGPTCWGTGMAGSKMPSTRNVKSLALGSKTACVIDDGGLKCWGSSWLFDRILANAPNLINPKEVVIGSWHICAIDQKGAHCWSDRTTEEAPILKNPRKITAGHAHACAFDDDGLQCWGTNNSGQLETPFLKNPKLVKAGYFHTCAQDDYGVKCWGGEAHLRDAIAAVPVIAPSFDVPLFGLDTLIPSLAVLIENSSPVRAALIKELSAFAEENLQTASASKAQKLNILFANYLILDLLSHVILSSDSQYYLDKVIPAYTAGMTAASYDLGVRSSVELDLNPLLAKTALKVIHSALLVLQDFLTVEDRSQTLPLFRSLGTAMGSPTQTHIRDVVHSSHKIQGILEKLKASSKTSFLVVTLNSATEWLSHKVK